MGADTEKIVLGSCTITADGVDLGYTLGAVTIEVGGEVHQSEPDQLPAPGETFTKKQSVRVTGQFIQAKDQGTLLNVILPSATVAGDAVSFGRKPGYRSSQNSFQLVVHPDDQGSTTTYDLTIYKAVSTEKTKHVYTKDGERVWDFEFIALYDDSRTDGDRLCKWGASADTTPPGRTSTSPADGAAAQLATVNIVIVFDESMSVRTLVDDSGHSPVVVYDSTNEAVVACAASVSTTTSANDTLTLNPDSSLTAGATINVLVPEFCKDVAGNAHAGTQTDFAVAA